jgi:hypothetical protein
MLVIGGAIAIISFSILGYYTLQFVDSIQQEGKYTIAPGDSLNVIENIGHTQGIGIYVVAFPEFVGQASITITDSVGNIIIDKTINPPIVIETFSTEVLGSYSLELRNPTDQTLEAAVGLGDYEDMFSRRSNLSPVSMFILVSLLGIGIALTIAGATITILDRNHTNKKMKQFGDTSDLI